ncbi:MAG TPA: hypothetical protein VJX67_03760 [Blastocatellia bacterium]|nr:hypothetical protein [Blastocatellia bacterium]
METECRVQFLLEQQAKHDAQISELRTHLFNVAQSEGRTNAIVAVLAERQVRTEEELTGLTEKISALIDRQSQTEQMFQSLVDRQSQTEQVFQSLIDR